MSVPGCRTGKVVFGSWTEAQLAVTSAKIRRFLHGPTKRREERAYQCDWCRLWHLTSSPDRAVSA